VTRAGNHQRPFTTHSDPLSMIAAQTPFIPWDHHHPQLSASLRDSASVNLEPMCFGQESPCQYMLHCHLNCC